jgi:gamma-glutamyltranspeptidase / glutathione hydrolase
MANRRVEHGHRLNSATDRPRRTPYTAAWVRLFTPLWLMTLALAAPVLVPVVAAPATSPATSQATPASASNKTSNTTSNTTSKTPSTTASNPTRSTHTAVTPSEVFHAAIASAHPLASAAGERVLAQGGNAFDAAIAVSAVLSVVEPASSGIGGGGFFLIHEQATHKDVFLDAREIAPQAASADMYKRADGTVDARASRVGPKAAAIPGQPALWAYVAKHYGRLPLSVSLLSAIEVARAGFPLYPRLQNAIKVKQAQLSANPDAARIFLVDGQVPDVGTVIRQPELAQTLALIARSDASEFYHGDFVKRLVASVREDGGIWTEADFDGYKVIEREPVRFEYRGTTIVTAPPPSSGGIVLAETLGVMGAYEDPKLARVDRIQLMTEALRRAYHDRAQYLGDPDYTSIPTRLLLNADYWMGLRSTLRLDKATPSEVFAPVQASPESPSTTHFSILDVHGNRVAATQSVNLFFGATYMARGQGFFLNDTMDDFAAAPLVPNAFGLVGGKANSIAPGKRALSSMTPTFAENDKGLLIIGSPGGSTIITNVLYGLLGWLDGLDATTLVTRPRIHHQYLPDEITYEAGALSDEEIAALTARGQHLRQTAPWGNTQIITVDKHTLSVQAASDPRGFGAGRVY